MLAKSWMITFVLLALPQTAPAPAPRQAFESSAVALQSSTNWPITGAIAQSIPNLGAQSTNPNPAPQQNSPATPAQQTTSNPATRPATQPTITPPAPRQ